MNVLENKTDTELHKSILAEIAKASNELKSARSDVEKANSRLKFVILLTNTLIERQGD